jgi:tripartite-type tricarboxylate transporter receptor subunit TctC
LNNDSYLIVPFTRFIFHSHRKNMAHTSKLALTLSAFAALTALAVAPSAQAQTFPSKPVTLMVPYPAGGGSDTLARSVNTALGKELGQPVIVENLGGAGGSIGAQKVLNAPSDGYYLYQGSPNELILAGLANSAVKFKSEDFRAVQIVGNSPMAILVRQELPANNADELISYAAKVAKEGKPVTYASVGVGSLYHLLGEQISKQTGITMTHVPYKGIVDVIRDLVGNQVDMIITPYATAQVTMAKQGRFKFIAALSATRQKNLPDVPSVDEGKALKGFHHAIWNGYFVKKDTPEAIVQVFHKAIVNTLTDPAIKASLEAQGGDLAKPLSLEQTNKVYVDGVAQFRAIAKSINLEPQ